MRNKKSKYVIIITVMLVGLFIVGLSYSYKKSMTKEILLKAIEAQGGEEVIQGVDNYTVKKSFTNLDNSGLSIIYFKGADKIRLERIYKDTNQLILIYNGDSIYIAENGEAVVDQETISTFKRQPRPRRLETISSLTSLSRLSPLGKVRYLGKKVSNRKTYLILKLIIDDGRISSIHYLFDADSYLLSRIERRTKDSVVFSELRFSDFKKVGKMTLPFLRERYRRGEKNASWIITEYSFKQLTDDLFFIPEP